ncbi:Major capsid protein VP1, partial [Clarias magur]
IHQPLHEREDREEGCVPLQCSSYHLRAESGKGEEGEGQEVSIRPWADFTP